MNYCIVQQYDGSPIFRTLVLKILVLLSQTPNSLLQAVKTVSLAAASLYARVLGDRDPLHLDAGSSASAPVGIISVTVDLVFFESFLDGERGLAFAFVVFGKIILYSRSVPAIPDGPGH